MGQILCLTHPKLRYTTLKGLQGQTTPLASLPLMGLTGHHRPGFPKSSGMKCHCAAQGPTKASMASCLLH